MQEGLCLSGQRPFLFSWQVENSQTWDWHIYTIYEKHFRITIISVYFIYISASFGLFLGTSTTRGFFFGVFGTSSDVDLFFPSVSFFGVAIMFSWFTCGDVTSKSDTTSDPSPELFRGPQRISAAWIARTLSWFLAPSNLSQYTLCSHRCLIKQTLLLYSFPAKK